MQNEFIPYEQALVLKSLGFKELCFGWYQNGRLKIEMHPLNTGNQTAMRDVDCNAPTFRQAFRFLREKFNLNFEITVGATGYNAFVKDFFYNEKNRLQEFTYEEAELACLQKMIDLTCL